MQGPDRKGPHGDGTEPPAGSERPPAVRMGDLGWNALVRLASHVLTLLLGIFTVSVAVKSLGVEAYGVVGTVGVFVAYASIATAALNATVGRGVVFALANLDHDRASRELSTVVFGLVGVFALLLPLLGLLGWGFLERLVVLPAHLVLPSKLLFELSLVSLLFSTLAGPLGVSLFVRNRLDLAGMAAVVRSLAFLVLLWLLLTGPISGLSAYGLATLAVSVLFLAWHLMLHHRLLPEVEVRPRFFDRRILQEVLSLGGWMTLNQIGVVVLLQTDVLVANRVLGPLAAGQLAALSSISLQVRALAGVVSGLFAPAQVALAASNQAAEFATYLFRSIKIVTLFVAVVVGVLCGLAEPILVALLGPGFRPLAPLAILMLAPLVPILGVMPAWNALLAIGRVRVPAVATILTGLVGIALSVLLATEGLGLTGIVLGGSLALGARNGVFAPWYLWRTCRIGPAGFARHLLLGGAMAFTSFLLASASGRLIGTERIGSLVMAAGAACGLCSLLALPLVWRDLMAVQAPARPEVRT